MQATRRGAWVRSGIAWAVAVALAGGCGPGGGAGASSAPTPRGDPQLVALRAFARLYGVVRWFHPSDEAAAIAWNRYAVVGVHDIRTAADRAALQRALAAWVAPIGPSVQILGPGEAAAPITVDVGAPQVAWQHEGPGFDGGQLGAYQSRRTNRVGMVAGAATWSAFSQRLDAASLRGRTLRLRSQLRAGAGDQVGAWLRVDRPGGAVGFFDNMMDRPVTSSAWTAGTIEGAVAADAVAVTLGGLVMGADGWFDGFALEVADGRGGWQPVPLANPDFDDGDRGWSAGVGRGDPSGYTLAVIDGARDGGRAARLSAGGVALTADLFPERPAADEVAVIDLGDGLSARVPLSLASRDDHTVPVGDLAAAEARTMALPATLTADDADVRVADVVVMWGVLAHFYPYHDVIATRWWDALDGMLAEAIAATTAGEHRATLARVMAAAEDGHGGVSPAATAGLPLELGVVEGTLVVLSSAVPEVERGDVVRAIDGVAADAALATARLRTSGSPQWRTALAALLVGVGPEGPATVTVEHGGTARSVTLTRAARTRPPAAGPPIEEVRPGVWRVDLATADRAAIEARIATLAAARGVIFDMRGYPNGTHEVLRHLLPAPETDRWMHVAHVIRPLTSTAPPPHAWTSFGWDMTPAEPRLRGTVVFLTGPGAISYAESVMGYVEALKLPIVGAATAGTNGNVRSVALPSGASFRFTGMRVTRHDGSRSHLEGIRPTLTVAPTLAGVRAGRDEVLERALTLIPAP